MSTATDLVERFAAAFVVEDREAMAACYAEHAVLVHPMAPEGIRGRDAIQATAERVESAFGDNELTVDRIIEDGDQVAVELTFAQTHKAPLALPDGNELAATNKRFTGTFATVLRLDGDGLIAEEHRYLDIAGVMAQLLG